jgi:hypothetical protein
MKIKKFLTSMIIAISFLTLNILFAAAETPPLLPSSYWGTVKLNGENIEAGEIITAWMDGRQVASAEVTIFNEESVYSIKVPWDLEMVEETVLFFLDDFQSNETGTWVSGTNTELNLTFTSSGDQDHQVFLPLILN